MGASILLVDDEEGIRTVLGISLADAGYHVTTAASGEEALARFAERKPDIVLTDIKMPGLSGLDLLERLKAADPEVEVIMLTGHGDMDLAIQSLKRDATDFLTKPVNDDMLEVALRRARERIDMRRRLRGYTENLEQMVRDQSSRLVEAERQLAALQTMDGIASGIRSLCSALDDGGLFNELPCFVAVHNADLEIVSTNQLYKERLGHRIGSRSWEAYAGRGPGDRLCPVVRVLETGEGFRSNEVLLGRNGQEIPVIVNTAPIYGNDGDVELVLELSVDVSEVRRLREDLRLTRERFRQLFDESPCYVAVMDRDFGVVEANRRYREDFGDPTGRRCHDAFAHRMAPCSGCPAQRTFEDGRPHQAETVVTARDGRQVNVLVWTAPLRDAAGEIAEVMEMSTDITELRRLQDRLSQLGLLLGSTAHGIKGLLTALDGGVYRLGSGIARGDAARVQDSHQDIRHLVDRLRKMVLDLLYYAKNRELNWEVVVARAFAEDTATLVEAKATERGVRFVRDFAEAGMATGGDGGGADLGTFEADAGALSSALVNLLENAVEACAADTRKQDHAVTFRVRGAPDEVTFTIIDNGTGMDRETREKLFTLFFSSKGSAGTGIGLFVASQVVRQHGGHIAVASERGEGSTFTVSLPRRLPEAVRQGESACDERTDNGG
ncbi:response regulator [Nitratidesulfovibrio sp. HK-II]|uniref:hybrid sensor histidine kinase/response regulator n=1 Tax=Nitratidesulfovibrio sp. HK-II TaxID=2009266 RepID=UPI000E2EEDC3|nr:response regulator [Nitratidesulfovibrio sp. HK-II]GBO96921.1 signal transduction histidine kinase [Nitratidesulfovibrio sp. HK-II]